MGTLKLLASWGFVIVLVQPIGNLGVIPPFLPDLTNGVVEELLVLGIGCNPEIRYTDFYNEGEIDIGRIGFVG